MGPGFESQRDHKKGTFIVPFFFFFSVSVAQLVEQLTLNQRATGSNPVGDT